MFHGLKNAAATVKTLKLLCEAALREAEREGLMEVSAEHFLLAAFELPDGTAARSFQAFGVDAERLRDSIERQHAEALVASGFAPGAMPPPAPITRSPKSWALPSDASARAILERLSQAGPTAEALRGAHVVLAALGARRGVVPRVLHLLDIAPEALAASARAECNADLNMN
jgi:ATP-dependent Clp protease ATP-binding subunit ClpA